MTTRLKLPLAAFILCLLLGSAYAVIRIDITSPGRSLPIAVSELAGPHGAEIARVISEDLDYTGLFAPVDREGFIERPEKEFNRLNWALTGAETVLKGRTEEEAAGIKVTAYLYDVADGAAMLHKEYGADNSLLRPLAHAIAGDIYQRLTGRGGVFRTKIAFVASGKGEKELCLSDWDGQRIIKPGIRAVQILSPHWSKDGGRLIYSALRGGRWGIYMLDFNEMTEKLIYASKGTLIAGDFFPGGDEFIFSSSEEGTPALYTHVIPGGRTRRLTSTRGIEVSPALSPDGQSIAFVSDRGGSPQVYIMDRNGYNINRITFEGSYNTSPSWSPDGGRIAFVGRHKGKNQIYTVNPDGSALIRLTENGNNEDPSFSPDGRFVAFTSDRTGGREIFTMRADGQGQRSITPKGLNASKPRWSPG